MESERLSAVEIITLIFQYSEVLAKKVIEENNDELQDTSETVKNVIKEVVKQYFVKEFIEELKKKLKKMKINFFSLAFLQMKISKKNVNKHSREIRVERGRYGVCKKEYYHFDCVDLHIEMLVLLNCEFIGTCRPCTNILKWIIEILSEKWDDIRFINFEKALEIARNLIIPNSVLVDYYQQQKKEIKDICRKAKVADDQDVIFENQHFFC